VPFSDIVLKYVRPESPSGIQRSAVVVAVRRDSIVSLQDPLILEPDDIIELFGVGEEVRTGCFDHGLVGIDDIDVTTSTAGQCIGPRAALQCIAADVARP